MGIMSTSAKCLRDLSEEIAMMNNKERDNISALLKEFITTGGILIDIDNISNNRIAKLFNKLNNTFMNHNYRLQKALYAHHFHDAGKKSARNKYKVPEREYDEATRIIDMFSFHQIIESYSQFPFMDKPWKWVIEVDNEYENIDVYFSDRAIEDIMMSAMEGYIVPKGKGGKYTEIFGLCFGNYRSLETHNKFKGMEERKHLHIERCVVHLRGNFTASSFIINHNSLHVQSDIRDTFFPHENILGYFHTHPYKSKSYATNSGMGVTESSADKRFSVWLQEYLRKYMNERAWLHLIISIGKVNNEKRNIISKRVRGNVIDFSAGRYSFRIGVYRMNVDGTTNEKGIRLFCPKLLGLGG